jgi:hypothetical protein
MLSTLSDHLEIVWGALVALVIVVLLTPAVGGMARLLGVVDRPGQRRLNLRPGSCLAPRSRRRSGRSTTSAASSGGRS